MGELIFLLHRELATVGVLLSQTTHQEVPGNPESPSLRSFSGLSPPQSGHLRLGLIMSFFGVAPCRLSLHTEDLAMFPLSGPVLVQLPTINYSANSEAAGCVDLLDGTLQ